MAMVQDADGTWYDDGQPDAGMPNGWSVTGNDGQVPFALPGTSPYAPGVSPNDLGGYPYAPPIDQNTGTTPAGWAQDPNTHLWNFTDPGASGGPAAPGPAPAPGPGAGGTGGGGYQYQQYAGPMSPDYSFWQTAPTFTAPAFQAPAAFQAPSGDAVLSDPGYQFRLGQGQKALEQSAAGRGTLRTGGTLKDILGYGQNLASQEYGNVYGRAADAYKTNYGVSRDVFDRTYQGARDAFAPQLADWSSKMNTLANGANLAFNRQWDAYTYGHPSATDIYTSGIA